MTNSYQYLFRATQYCDAVVEYGKGSFVWDVNGKRYLDLNAGQFCLSFGHNYKPLNDIVIKQLEKIHHTNTATITPEFFEAAELMARINDFNLTKTMFLSTGSEANEAAIRYAKFFTKKNGILSVDKGYHGLTLASQGSTMGGVWALPQIPKTYTVPTPDYIHSDKSMSECDFTSYCIFELEKCIRTHKAELAAVIVEPVIGVGGMVQLPFEYLRVMRRLCDENNIVLIFDECQCGFGRSGEWFVFQQANVIPDILVSAKAMGAGFAVSSITMKKEIASEIELKLTHFSSHQNDPIAAAITSFVIKEMMKLDLVNKNKQKGDYLLKTIQDICSSTEGLCNPRGLGLMTAFDLDDSMITNYGEFSALLSKEMEYNGVLIQAVRQGRTFRVMPNFLISEEEIDFFKNACLTAYEAARQKWLCKA